MNRLLISALVAGALSAQVMPEVRAAAVQIRLPERFRVLTDQLFDLRIEATDLADLAAGLTVKVDGKNVTAQLPSPEITTDDDDNPASLDKAWTFRSISFGAAGVVTVEAFVEDGAGATRIGIQEFDLKNKKGKNIILFIGDAMGTAYRDLGRIVAKSTDNRFREGFFDELQEMDQMPVTGMVMTYALDRIVPDSANAATAWASGNKTIDGALNAFPDNDDWRFFDFSAVPIQDRKHFALNNPRVETLWEYLKRRHGYKTGIVTTSDVADATPGGEGGHTITRSLLKDVTRQYVDGVFTAGTTFDVILGGGQEHFISRTLANSGDTRNLANELVAAGFSYVQTRTELSALPANGASSGKLLGLFRTSNMNVAYDKLGLIRPPDEPVPSFGGFTDQPFLEEMTAKAIATLSKDGGPFILMVEGASIDKQSHPNHAAGQIWDTIEFDKSVGVGRTFAASASKKDETLVLVTADHDQSIHILGLVDTTVAGATENIRSGVGFTGLVGEVDFFPDYENMSNGYPSNSNRYRIAVGYRTGGHTGSSVPLTAEGPGALLFTGYYDQTDIFFKMARVLSSETQPLDVGLQKKSQLTIIEQNY